MAESSGFFGSTAGDRKYTSGQFSKALKLMTRGASGVVRGVDSELALAQSAGSGLVATGAAIHEGRWYLNETSSVSKVLSAVTINNKRRDRFVIRFDPVTARSAVVTVINGVETTGTPASPAIGADDVLLGYIESFNNAGVYSYSAVDERVYGFDNKVTVNEIAADAVGTSEIIDSSVTQAKMADNSIGTAEIIDSNVTTAKIADSSVTTSKIAGDAITNAKLANMAVDTIKGRRTSGTGDPEDLSPANVLNILSPIISDDFSASSTSAVTANVDIPSGQSGSFLFFSYELRNTSAGTLSFTLRSPNQTCNIMYSVSSEAASGIMDSPSTDIYSGNSVNNLVSTNVGAGDYFKVKALVSYK